MNDKLIEKVARAMTIANGYNPDEMIPRSGYSKDTGDLVERWRFDVEWAKRHLAAKAAIEDQS